MRYGWEERNTIVANLFNPAFCGEIIRVAALSFNKETSKKFPFALSFLVLPILLHKETRDRLPKSTKTYFFVWVEKNDDLFFDFSKRTKSMVKYTKEAISFLLLYKKIEFNEDGEIDTTNRKWKKIEKDEYEEYNDILKKAEMLGRWLGRTSDVKSLYSYFRITP